MISTRQTASVSVTPELIMQTGLGFWSSKVLLTAVNFELFTLLAKGAQTDSEIRDQLHLQPRGLYDFLDALVALNFLCREGEGAVARYTNTLETDVFLDKNKPSYVPLPT